MILASGARSNRQFWLSSLLLMFFVVSPAQGSGEPEQSREIAEGISNLFIAFKQVINQQQSHINNPEIGDKGLTSEVIIEKAMQRYLANNGKPFTFSKHKKLAVAQRHMIDSARVIMDEAQVLINEPGIGFKGFITAIFSRRLASEFTERSPNISFKFTAPLELLRSARNKADSWEQGVFDKQFSSPEWQVGKPYAEVVGENYRWMLPVYHQPGCLSCHGGPEGSIDNLGFIKEGAQLGDLAGALSVDVR